MTIERAFASASTTLDQTTPTLVNSMTITPPSGEYLLVFNGELTADATQDTGGFINFMVYEGGSELTGSRTFYEEDGSITDVSMHMTVTFEVNPNGSEAIEIRYDANSATNPLTMLNRELLLFPMSSGFQDTDTATDSTGSSTWSTLASMTRTPPADDYLLVFTSSADGPTGSTPALRISVGGSPIAASEVHVFMESSWNQAAYPFFLAASISPNGSEVVEIEMSSISNAHTVTFYDRSMNLMPVTSTDIFEATSIANDVDATTTDKLVDGMTITDPGVDTYMVLYASSQEAGSISNNTVEVDYTFRNAGSQETESKRQHGIEGSVDNARVPLGVASRVTVAGSTDDLEVFWQNSTTTSRTAKHRTFIAVREAAAAPAVVILKPYNYQPYLAR